MEGIPATRLPKTRGRKRRTDQTRSPKVEDENTTLYRQLNEKERPTSGQIAKNMTRPDQRPDHQKARTKRRPYFVGWRKRRTHTLNGRHTSDQINENTRTKKTNRPDQIAESQGRKYDFISSIGRERKAYKWLDCRKYDQTRPDPRSPKGEDEKRPYFVGWRKRRTHPLNGRPTSDQIAENTRKKKTNRPDQIAESRGRKYDPISSIGRERKAYKNI